MWQKCIDALDKWWPNTTAEERDSLLWCATCFPFGTAQDIEGQLREAAEKSQGNVQKALEMADAELHAAMIEGRNARY